ncbi:uncharacterized protein LOC124916107 [Impatiens glandulifera]|uniref:uncharacterized protein LOC124916107 n=1 Tax=Impatiens glandulifera TaxID=253017 RepID=UPI001FB0F6BD|nr:uncharacterized protein LOC124916107 [Impatiens glandulifera]
MERTCRPFRFKNKWLIKEDFIPRVQSWWVNQSFVGSPSSNLFVNLRNLRKFLKSWFVGDRALFCAKINDLYNKINVINENEEIHELFADEVSSQIHIVSKLLDMCKEEETRARQRSRATRLRVGNRNTKFFHGISNAQAKNNVINSISIVGEVYDSEPEISTSIVKFYKCLLKEPFKVIPKLNGITFDSISTTQKDILDAHFTLEEVEEAIKGCGSDKAPKYFCFF